MSAAEEKDEKLLWVIQLPDGVYEAASTISQVVGRGSDVPSAIDDFYAKFGREQVAAKRETITTREEFWVAVNDYIRKHGGDPDAYKERPDAALDAVYEVDRRLDDLFAAKDFVDELLHCWAPQMEAIPPLREMRAKYLRTPVAITEPIQLPDRMRLVGTDIVVVAGDKITIDDGYLAINGERTTHAVGGALEWEPA